MNRFFLVVFIVFFLSGWGLWPGMSGECASMHFVNILGVLCKANSQLNCPGIAGGAGNISFIFQKDCGPDACSLALKRLENDSL